jgi:oxygen-independent coproporphyrinogen-3 oxidase
MRADIIKRYAAPVPRYTSYPTANHFNPSVGAREKQNWLSSIAHGASVSLYIHIPFCHTLCWYCACSTKMTKRAEPVLRYLDALEAEIGTVAAQLAPGARVTHMHWGGGSPSLLDAASIRRLGAALRRHFEMAPDVEFAIEIDPRELRQDQVDAFVEIGINRVSLGVQDFNQKVQDAINRQQSFELTRDVIAQFRRRGIGSINIDLVYGLPHQTVESVKETIAQVLTLAPDRIAIFGYAHLPARVPHQKLIDETVLPDVEARFAQSSCLARAVIAAGYLPIGIDHFARAGDTMADQPVSRNFQGYTTDASDVLIGLGATAISSFPQGFAQNAVGVHDYERRIADGGVATVRGMAMTADDSIRAKVIDRLMCAFTFSATELLRQFGEPARTVIADADDLDDFERDGLIVRTADGFNMTPDGRPLVRTVCARFDPYLARQATRRHALAV